MNKPISDGPPDDSPLSADPLKASVHHRTPACDVADVQRHDRELLLHQQQPVQRRAVWGCIRHVGCQRKQPQPTYKLLLLQVQHWGEFRVN